MDNRGHSRSVVLFMVFQLYLGCVDMKIEWMQGLQPWIFIRPLRRALPYASESKAFSLDCEL